MRKDATSVLGVNIVHRCFSRYIEKSKNTDQYFDLNRSFSIFYVFQDSLMFFPEVESVINKLMVFIVVQLINSLVKPVFKLSK